MQGNSVLFLSKYCTNTFYHFRLLLYCSETLLHLGIWIPLLKNNGNLYSGVTTWKNWNLELEGLSLAEVKHSSIHVFYLFIDCGRKHALIYLFIRSLNQLDPPFLAGSFTDSTNCLGASYSCRGTRILSNYYLPFTLQHHFLLLPRKK